MPIFYKFFSMHIYKFTSHSILPPVSAASLPFPPLSLSILYFAPRQNNTKYRDKYNIFSDSFYPAHTDCVYTHIQFYIVI